MESHLDYFMESDEEIKRLEIKTDVEDVYRQARWAGIRPGMRVADIGCGPGITSRALYDLVQPGGEVVGVDIAPHRVAYAREKYGRPGLEFEHLNALHPMDRLGAFDFVWARFLLEYHKDKAFDIVRNLSQITRTGGIVCILDLDHNCLNHYGLPDRLIRAIGGVIDRLEQGINFDPFAGIKLYSYLYDLQYQAIDVTMTAHHLIFGDLKESDAFNWTKKVEVGARNSGFRFEEYPGGYEEFYQEFLQTFTDPRRFSYTPLIACRGTKPDPDH